MTTQDEEIPTGFQELGALGDVIHTEYDRALALIERGRAARRLREARSTMREVLKANTRSAAILGQQRLEDSLNAALSAFDERS